MFGSSSATTRSNISVEMAIWQQQALPQSAVSVSPLTGGCLGQSQLLQSHSKLNDAKESYQISVKASSRSALISFGKV